MSKATVVASVLNEEDLENQILDAAKAIGLDKELQSAKTIFIKPNLTYPVYKEGVTTRKEFVHSLVEVLTRMKPDLKIYIGEGEGGYNSFSMTEAFEIMGFNDLKKIYPNVETINLSKMPSKKVEIPTEKGPYKLKLPKIFFDEIDFSISCPLPKVHAMTKITLSFKNQWGCLPDVMRLKNHYMFNQIIYKIAHLLKFEYVFLDGKFGLDNFGPMSGDPVRVNWFVAANSLGAHDMVVAEMMGYNWKNIPHLKMAGKHGFLPKIEDVDVLGDIHQIKRKFSLKRPLWTYPALVAFHSSSLTHFFYISRWAKILHDIMYTVRKRPIEL